VTLASRFGRWWQADLSELAASATCWVAYSGGLDSTALLHLAHAHWSSLPAPRPSLAVVHVNHGLHPAAPAWEAHCQAVVAGLQLPFTSRTVCVTQQGRGLESAARLARYALFRELLGPGDRLLLAHHLDDQVETVWLRLLRGAGTAGLAGMAGARDEGAGCLLRPLLGEPRAALLAFARQQGLCWVEDPSNASDTADRNYLRNVVLPLIEQRWPGYRTTIGRSTELLRQDAALLTALLPPLPEAVSAFGEPLLPLAALRGRSPALQAGMLRAWLRQYGQAPPRARLVAFISQLHSAAVDRHPQLVTAQYVLRRSADAIHCGRTMVPVPPLPLPIDAARARAIPGHGVVRLVGSGALPALTLRFRRGGERCRLAGRRGHHTLKNILQERGVPPWWRDHVPLVFADATLLAVARPGAEEPLSELPGWAVHWQPTAARALGEDATTPVADAPDD